MITRPGSTPTGTGRLVGRWLAPLCDMAAAPGGMDRCLYVHACFCLAAGEVAQRTGGSYFLDCAIGGILGFGYCFSCCVWAPTRARLRMMHGIPGDALEDLVVTGALPCCYLAQALNHLDLVGSATARAGAGAPGVPPSAGAAGAPKESTRITLASGQF